MVQTLPQITHAGRVNKKMKDGEATTAKPVELRHVRDKSTHDLNFWPEDSTIFNGMVHSPPGYATFESFQ